MTQKPSLIYFLLIITLTLSACALVDTRPDAEVVIKKAAPQKVFFASYDEVWRAAHIIIKYPIAFENQDTGTLETETIKAIEGWIPPNQEKMPSSGVKYKLNFIFSKGSVGKQESVRVTIEKKMENQRDFFSDPEKIESDGLEEAVLFYRLERELIISNALKKIQNEDNKQLDF